MKTILITGGTGLVGQHLQKLLLEKGYHVNILSTNPVKADLKTIFYWEPKSNEIDINAFKNVDTIVHLAGANIAEGRWSADRKKLIVDSRTETSNLIFNTLKKTQHQVKTIVSSSATGYYGAITTEKKYQETDKSEPDFLGDTCLKWENSVDAFKQLSMRVVKLRTGIVLAKEGGIIKKLSFPIKCGLACALGSGNQYMPWIHIDDLCNMYLKAIEDEQLQGAYNAVAPTDVTNKIFTKAFANSIHRPFFMPAVPAFFLKLILGEMSAILLTGSKVSSRKISETGFTFKYADITKAFNNLLN